MEMSLASKVTLAASITTSLGIVLYVHWKQDRDQMKMHAGVLRDVERQRRQKIENVYRLQQQSEFAKELQKENESHPSSNRNT